jgi:hypothetical protein
MVESVRCLTGLTSIEIPYKRWLPTQGRASVGLTGLSNDIPTGVISPSAVERLLVSTGLPEHEIPYKR